MDSIRAVFFVTFIFTVSSAIAQPPRPSNDTVDRAPSSLPEDRWLQQLASDLEHLQEEIYYERGNYPQGLDDKVEQTSRAVAHFQLVLRRSNDPAHLRKDFREMDRDVHDLVKTLKESQDSWLRRQGSRILYSDEQVHYALQRRLETPEGNRRELLARHAHLLETEAREFETLAERVIRRDEKLRSDIHNFVEQTDHFHQVIEGGANPRHVQKDFEKVDDSWHHVVDRINTNSHYNYYLRSAAHDVNRVHNQIHDLIIGGDHGHEHASKEKPPVPPNPPNPPPQTRRPAIEFEIPGIGRFKIPR